MKISIYSWLLLLIQVLVVLVSTFGIVVTTYESRKQFARLEIARNQQREMLEEWGRLLLEESAFSSPSRVERVAREELKMILPDVKNIREFK